MSSASAGPVPTRVDRRLAWSVAGGALLLLVVLAAWLVPWDWVPGGTLRTPPADQVFTAREIARAEAYAWPVRLLSWSALAVSLVAAGALGVTPLGARWTRRLAGDRRWWLVSLVGTLLFCLAVRVVTLPFALAVRARSLDAGLTDQALGPWLRDVAVSFGITLVTSAVLVLLVVGVARRFPRRWFVPVGALGVVLAFAVAYVYPLAVEPLFNRFTPMADGPLKTSILQLADREGVRVDDVLVADASRRTTTVNAYVSGLGGTRRVVVYDTLLNDLPPDQVRAVVAHELGHAANHDVLVGTGLASVGALLGTALLALVLDARPLQRRSGTTGAPDPAVACFVLACLALGTLLATPAQNAVSRAIEARADRASLEATHDPAAFDRLQRQLALRSLADPTPPTWSQLVFGTHPTVLQRIGIAAALAREDRAG